MVDPKEPLPTNPKAFGEELKRLRDNAGLGIDDLINETKVSRRVFEALESGRFQYLPERVFSRNFVRQYAAFVGADEDKVLDAFDRAWDAFIVSSGSHPILLETLEPPRSLIRWQFWIPVALAAVVIAVILLAVVRGSGPSEDLAPDPRRSVAAQPTPTSFPSSLVSSPTPLMVEPADAATDAAVDEAVQVVIDVAEDKECWIHYRDREGRVDQRLLQGGDTLALELAWPAHLSIGNAAAVTVRIGDRTYSGLGEPGQVIHCEVSGDGLERLGG